METFASQKEPDNNIRIKGKRKSDATYKLLQQHLEPAFNKLKNIIKGHHIMQHVFFF